MLFLGLIIAFGGTNRIGLHDCVLKNTPYYSHTVHFCKTNISVFPKRPNVTLLQK
jgi:hypothetical protein